MVNTTNEDLSRIVVDESYPHPVAKVWRAWITPDIMAQWLMPNDSQPVVGHECTMQGTAYEKANFSGNTLRSIVTWTLKAEGKGTRVFLEQAGYHPEDPTHQLARNIMSGGWTHGVLPKLEGRFGIRHLTHMNPAPVVTPYPRRGSQRLPGVMCRHRPLRSVDGRFMFHQFMQHSAASKGHYVVCNTRHHGTTGRRHLQFRRPENRHPPGENPAGPRQARHGLHPTDR